MLHCAAKFEQTRTHPTGGLVRLVNDYKPLAEKFPADFRDYAD
jgi:hypothetical protein